MRGDMMKKADLHAHTTMSDGILSPKELVELAVKMGLAVIAITDHDTTGGFQEAMEVGQKLGVEVIPAVEMSTMWDDVAIDILGYFIQPDHPVLRLALDKQRELRQERNKLILDRLSQLGISITEEEVQARQEGTSTEKNAGRVHIGEILIEKGLVADLNEAFDKYLGKDGIAYVNLNRTTPQEAIQVIQASGGVAVIAHPGLYKRDDLIPEIAEAGLTGLEVNHPDHPEEDKQKYLAMAVSLGLIPTAGSDFHGERNGHMHHANLGTCVVPISTVEKLRAKAKSE
jgi:predicted metal-dependent phosphoesterase TrpH